MHSIKRFFRSIAGRSAFASVLILPVLILATGLGIDRAFKQSLLRAEEQQLTTWAYLLLAAAEAENGQLEMPAAFTEPRFSQPGSHLYAFVHRESGGVLQPAEMLWQSPSSRWLDLRDLGLTQEQALAPVVSFFAPFSDDFFVLRYRIQWEQEEGEDLSLVFSLYHASEEYRQQLQAFSTTLWRWLSGVGVLLLLGQWLLLYWSLRPLHWLSGKLSALNRGEVASITGAFAGELQPLVDNLNQLLVEEKSGRERYRNALSDLAHSVKTPLAVLRNEVHETTKNDALMVEQIQRLEDIVSRQLARASLAHGAIRHHQNAMQVASRLATSLKKLFPNVTIELGADKLMLPVDEKDLFDLLGNVMENACKYGAETIKISGGDSLYRGSQYKTLIVSDDGPGMPESVRAGVLARGLRADESKAGQGLGLSLVQDIVLAQGGELTLETSDLGGLAVCCRFPV